MKISLKRYVIVLSVVITMMACFVLSASAERTVVKSGDCGAVGSDVTWTLYSDGELVISGEGDMKDYRGIGLDNIDAGFSPFYENDSIKKVTVEEGVTSIGDNVFCRTGSIKSVVFPSSATRIGNYAFYDCSSLETVKFKEGLTEIGTSAFYSCRALKKTMEFPDSLKKIEKNAFEYCSGIKKILLGKGLEFVGEAPFSKFDEIYAPDVESWIKIKRESVTSLFLAEGVKLYLNGVLAENVVIPESVTEIGDYVFNSCETLKSVKIHKNLEKISDTAFAYCLGLEKFSVDEKNLWYSSDKNGVLYNKDKTSLVMFPQNSSLKRYDMPDSVEVIENYALVSNRLKELSLSSNLKKIGEGSIRCRLNDIVIPSSLTRIEKNAFASYLFKNVYIESLESWLNTELADESSIPFLGAEKVYFEGVLATDVVVPHGVKKIGNWAFYYLESLRSITIPDSVESIGQQAFCYCSGLERITISDSVESIGNEAFRFCTALERITIPKSVKIVEQSAFGDCKNLKEVVLEDGVGTVKKNAFVNCTALESVVLGDSVVAESNIFGNNTLLTKIEIGATHRYEFIKSFRYQLKEIYYRGTYEQWLENYQYCYLPQTFVHYNHTVDAVHSITERILKEPSCKVYGEKISECSCSGYFKETILPTGHIDENLNLICDQCSVKLIAKTEEGMCGENLMWFRSGRNIMINGGGTMRDYYISTTPFYNDNSIERVILGHKIKSLGANTFKYCTGLKNITISSELTEIKDGALYGCYNLTDVYYSGTQEQWKKIVIGKNNEVLDEAVIHYNHTYTFNRTEQTHTYTVHTETVSGCNKEGVEVYKCSCGAEYRKNLQEEHVDKDLNGICDICFGDILTSEGSAGTIQWYKVGTTLTVKGNGVLENPDFKNSVEITRLFIEEGITGIAEDTFAGCSNLMEITLPKSVKTIGVGAFSNCESIEDVYYCSSKDNWQLTETGSDNDCLKTAMIHFNCSDEQVHSVTCLIAAPDCTNEGAKYYECSCGAKVREKLDKDSNNHIADKYYEGRVEATCSIDGHTGTVYCKACQGYVYEGSVIKSDGMHEYYLKSVKRATNKANGYILNACKGCDKTKKRTIYKIKTVKLHTDTYLYDTFMMPLVVAKDSKGTDITSINTREITPSDGVIGKYTVEVTFTGNYKGVYNLEYTVVPSKPKKVYVSKRDSDSLTLKWSEVEGATGYKIYIYNTETKKFKSLKTTKNEYSTIEGLNPDSTYKFAVKAYAKLKDGSVAYSTVYTTVSAKTSVAPPAKIKVAGGNSKVKVKWSEVDGAYGYVVYMATSKNGTYKKVAATKELSYTKTGLVKGKTYYFKVRAYSKMDGKNAYSNYTSYKSAKVK